jgi:hypothetical protein
MNSKKLIAGMIALAIGVVAVAPVQAATADELANQITQLQQELANLQGQVGGTGTTASGVANTSIAACTGVTFSRNLTLGSEGNDVKCLQAILNQSADTAVAATGVGSAGNESTYFGGLTKAAVVAFQNKFAADVLTPVGLTAGTGFVGASTRAELNEKLAGAVEGGNGGNTGSTLPAGCTTTAGYSPISGAKCDSGTTGGSTPGGVTQTGAEGAITVSINPAPANNVKVYEGDSKVAIMGMKIRATGSDVDVQRVTLMFNQQPYSYFTKLYLYDGTTEVVSADLNSTTVSKVSSSNYQITLSNFASKVLVSKDTTKVLTAEVDVLPGISSGLLTGGVATVRVAMPSATAVRAVDQAGLNQYDGVAYSGSDATTYRSFTVNASQSANATITVSKNSLSPADRNVVADTNGDITGASLLTFDVKATKDTLLLDQINNVALTTTNEYPDTVYLVDSNQNTIGTDTPTAGGLVSFTDLNYTINKDATATFTLKYDDLSAAGAGEVIYATVNGDDNTPLIIATKSNGANVAASAISGSAVSNRLYEYVQGPEFTVTGISTSSVAKTTNASSTISATFNVAVAAKGADVYLGKTGAFFVAYAKDGVASDTNVYDVTSITYNQPSGTTAGTNTYKVAVDQTATFAVTATWQVTAAGNYDLRMRKILWGLSNTAYTTASSYMSNSGGVAGTYDTAWISQTVYLQ